MGKGSSEGNRGKEERNKRRERGNEDDLGIKGRGENPRGTITSAGQRGG